MGGAPTPLRSHAPRTVAARPRARRDPRRPRQPAARQASPHAHAHRGRDPPDRGRFAARSGSRGRGPGQPSPATRGPGPDDRHGLPARGRGGARRRRAAARRSGDHRRRRRRRLGGGSTRGCGQAQGAHLATWWRPHRGSPRHRGRRARDLRHRDRPRCAPAERRRVRPRGGAPQGRGFPGPGRRVDAPEGQGHEHARRGAVRAGHARGRHAWNRDARPDPAPRRRHRRPGRPGRGRIRPERPAGRGARPRHDGRP